MIESSGFSEAVEVGPDLDPRATILMGNRWVTPEERQEIWWEQEASHHILACKREPVRKHLAIIPAKYLFALMENPAPMEACCRNAVEHEIEAFWTSKDGIDHDPRPDLYVLHCKCGRKHRRFCVGGAKGSGAVDTNPRPVW